MERFTICHLITNRSININDTFDSRDWPLHITIAGFEIERTVGLELPQKLATIANDTVAYQLQFEGVAYFGPNKDIAVTIVKRNEQLLRLLGRITAYLTEISAAFRHPTFFTQDAYKPHATIQKNEHAPNRSIRTITDFSLIQHEPNGIKHERLLADTFKLANSH